MLEDELSALQPVELIHYDTVRRAYRAGQRIEHAEAHRLQPPAFLQQLQLEVALANDALRLDRERVAKERRRKTLTPDVRFQHPRHLERVIRGLELAVGLDDPRSLLLRQQSRNRAFEERCEALELRLLDRQAGRLRVPAEAQQQAGFALCEQVEAIAQVQPGDRAPGAAQLAVLRARKADRRPMDALAHPRGQ